MSFKYKPSRYNFIKDGTNGSQIIYNTKTGAIDLIEPINVEKVKSILSNMDSEFVEKDDLYSAMFEQGYIIDENTDEVQDIIDWNRASNNAENIAYLTILPTETCNFTCPYCFIYTFREHHMTPETYDALYNYCYNHFEKNKEKETCFLDISWFGGEPLIVVDKIIEFMKRLLDLKKTYPNVNLTSSIVTNGYYLNYKTFKQLLDVDIRRYQVTLDGDAENHDKLRTLKGKKPTFNTIYTNILEIIHNVPKEESFSFSIRGNFLKSSVKNCENLLEMFKRDFAHDNRFRIYFRPVYNFETDRDTIDVVKDDILDIEEGIRIQNRLSFYSLQGTNNVLEKVSNPLPQPTHSWCTSVSRNANIIGYDGSVFSCDTMVTEKDMSIGQLQNDGTIKLNDKASVWKKSIFDNKEEANGLLDECLNCKFLPVCVGGCNRSRQVSGTNPCFWTESIIYDAMDEYAEVYQ